MEELKGRKGVFLNAKTEEELYISVIEEDDGLPNDNLPSLTRLIVTIEKRIKTDKLPDRLKALRYYICGM